jgi:hypothetical protein
MRSALFRLVLGFILLSPVAQADTVESVIMPGKVIAGHAKLETDCKQCHVRFNRSAQSGLCLDCHKDVARDVITKQGYHGRLKEQECRACHTEHKGRDVNIAPLDEKRFDHSLTDFALKGGHAGSKVQCRDCHPKGKKHREAPSNCYACHQKDDKHKGSLGKACADCHSEKNWKDTLFDHSKTKFPLTGKHRDVQCKSCHSDPKFKGAPTQCVACHRKDDQRKGHQGKFGDKCETCHTDRDWKNIRFNHDRDTKYPLRGKHAQAKCSGCHTGILYQEKLTTTCYACHQKDDKHKGQEGKKCESCHNERNWKETRFDHGLSRFPLLGKHAKVECKKCHLTPTFKDAKTDCYACHKKDDKHKLRLGSDCGTCHNARDWKAWNFDHDRRTTFKLDGAHRGLDCLACHKKPMTGKISLSGTCASCHDDDDVHHGGFGRDCQRCHFTNSFKKIRPGMGGMPR